MLGQLHPNIGGGGGGGNRGEKKKKKNKNNILKFCEKNL
jgi:hypothetical protein